LHCDNITAGYHGQAVINDVSVVIPQAGFVSIIGANGSGKSTLLKTIMGLVPTYQGEIYFEDVCISGLSPDQRFRKGIGYVPEGRHVLSSLSVEENLLINATRTRKKNQMLGRAYDLFPVLYERRKESAARFSGGQQQMLAIARAIVSDPSLLILDEPSLGLSPILMEEILEVIHSLNKEGLSIFLSEQNAEAALDISRYCYVLLNGKVAYSGEPTEVKKNEVVRINYLGF
jgi:branched-chain amino acid transport system ATP-binding protein